MSDVIKVERVSKRYILGRSSRTGQTTFREAVAGMAVAPFRWATSRMSRERPAERELWALKDVSFKVEAGEVLGIVGRNGAGKSTLLKLLSRITQPTAGRAEVEGRVGSLLEVGTGFHPELTGRENVYLYGAILGMSRREIARKFDEIVAFSEVEKFLDTPMKRYSSGMHTRLGFAVASHLDPHILIVDEVLAVGDVQFQKKCIKRMRDARLEGRTILFVSHSMSSVKMMCTRGILMERGQITFDGNVDEAVNRNLSSGATGVRDGTLPEGFPRLSDVPGTARVLCVQMMDGEGKEINQFFFGQPFEVRVQFEVMKEIEDAVLEISVSTPDGVQVSYSSAMDGGAEPVYLRKGLHEMTARFENTLLPREYSVNAGIHFRCNGATADYVERAFDFSVQRVAESGKDHFPWGATRGLIRLRAQWSVDGQDVPAESMGYSEAGV